MSTVHIESDRVDLPVAVVLVFGDGCTVVAGPDADPAALAVLLVDAAFSLTSGGSDPRDVPRRGDVFDVERDGL